MHHSSVFLVCVGLFTVAVAPLSSQTFSSVQPPQGLFEFNFGISRSQVISIVQEKYESRFFYTDLKTFAEVATRDASLLPPNFSIQRDFNGFESLIGFRFLQNGTLGEISIYPPQYDNTSAKRRFEIFKDGLERKYGKEKYEDQVNELEGTKKMLWNFSSGWGWIYLYYDSGKSGIATTQLTYETLSLAQEDRESTKYLPNLDLPTSNY